jgi:hypothetical protein
MDSDTGSDSETSSPSLGAYPSHSGPPPDLEEVPGLHGILEQLRQEIEAWCGARPDASALGIAAAYDELRHLDTKEQLLLPKDGPESGEWVSLFDPKPAALVLRDATRDEVTRTFDTRRQLLRSRALHLSRGGVRPLTINDLPLDILRIIFNHFHENTLTEGWRSHRRVSWAHHDPQKSHRRRRWTIRKLRLVSRLFCELASPLLFPILHLQLSQSSLDLANNIASSPLIAAGVWGVRVSLRYRPKQHAKDIARYHDSRLLMLEKQAREVEHQCKNYWSGDVENPEAAERQRTLDSFHRMREEWAEYVEVSREQGQAAEGPLSEYQDMLRQGHAEFGRLHREQRRLLKDADFANSLAVAVARMPHAGSFAIDDRLGRNSDYDDTSLLTDTERLSQFMSAPLSWLEIEDESTEARRPTAGLECVRLLWELPIALHRAGATLRELTLQSFPLYTNFPMLTPQDQMGVPTWDKLAAACGRLEVFECSQASRKGIRDDYLPDEDRSHIDGFFGAILSRCSQYLRVLYLDFYNLSINTGQAAPTPEGSYHADPFITRLQALPGIRRLSLGHLELQHGTFHKLCSNLGDKLEHIWLCDITLHNGGWADALDLLLKMTTPSPRHHGFQKPTSWSVSKTNRLQDDPLVVAVLEYLRGDRETNALRDVTPAVGRLHLSRRPTRHLCHSYMDLPSWQVRISNQ